MEVNSVSVIVPIYNERDNLVELHRQLVQALIGYPGDWEIVLVDDGSTDGSPAILRELAVSDPLVRVVLLRRNFGQTAAMLAGIDAAGGEVLVLLDGDLQNDPADIPRLLAKLAEGYDLVCGWRKNRQDTLWTRKIPSRIANWLIARVTRVAVHDLGCSLKAMRRDLADELQLIGEMHRFIPVLAQRRGARCAEVVTHHRPRVAGKSKYGLARTFRVLLDLITVKFLLDYFASPIKFFGKMAGACIAIGMVAGVATLWMKLRFGVDMTGNPLLMLTVFAMTSALQLIGIGVLGELGIRIYYGQGHQRPYAIAEQIGFSPAESASYILPLAG